jgi:hypothetical protein
VRMYVSVHVDEVTVSQVSICVCVCVSNYEPNV